MNRNSPQCDDLWDYFPDLFAGDISADELPDSIRDHLRTCVSCQATEARLSQIAGALAVVFAGESVLQSLPNAWPSIGHERWASAGARVQVLWGDPISSRWSALQWASARPGIRFNLIESPRVLQLN